MSTPQAPSPTDAETVPKSRYDSMQDNLNKAAIHWNKEAQREMRRAIAAEQALASIEEERDNLRVGVKLANDRISALQRRLSNKTLREVDEELKKSCAYHESGEWLVG